MTQECCGRETKVHFILFLFETWFHYLALLPDVDRGGLGLDRVSHTCFLNLEIKGLQHQTWPKAHLYGMEPALVGTVQLIAGLEADGKGWLQLQSQAVCLADCVALFKDSLY